MFRRYGAEGVVWTLEFHAPGYRPMLSSRFKVKGEKHSASKAKTVASVDPEKHENVEKFVQYA